MSLDWQAVFSSAVATAANAAKKRTPHLEDYVREVCAHREQAAREVGQAFTAGDIDPRPDRPHRDLRRQRRHRRSAFDRALGIDPGPSDGSFGPHTAAAVLAFQLMNGLVADGEAGPQTLKALGLA
jgi:murein L,D-transpeptidase YcbB/YkuD